MTRTLLLIGSLSLAGALSADNGDALDAPEPPPALESGEAMEPEVTIRRTERETIYEYRRNGRLFLVRVLPQAGPPYFFVDTDGDGQLEYRPGDPHANQVNQWLLYRW